MTKIHNFGYFGINHLLNELKDQGYTWKNMKEDVPQFIRKFKICAAHNPIKRGCTSLDLTNVKLGGIPEDALLTTKRRFITNSDLSLLKILSHNTFTKLKEEENILRFNQH